MEKLVAECDRCSGSGLLTVVNGIPLDGSALICHACNGRGWSYHKPFKENRLLMNVEKIISSTTGDCLMTYEQFKKSQWRPPIQEEPKAISSSQSNAERFRILFVCTIEDHQTNRAVAISTQLAEFGTKREAWFASYFCDGGDVSEDVRVTAIHLWERNDDDYILSREIAEVCK